MKRRYRLLLVLMLCAAIVLAGCSNVKQLNRISFVTAIGIDKSASGVMVHALVAVPGNYTSLSPGNSGGSGKQRPNYIISEEGAEVAQALYKMKRKTARDLNYGHTRFILISDELAKEDVGELLDLFMRRAEFQINAWIAVTKGSAKKILQTVPEAPQSVTDYLVDTFSQAGSDSMEIFPIYLYQFYSYLREPGKTPYAMEIDTEKEGNQLQLTDLVLFRDAKMVGTLAPQETKYLQMLSGKRLRSESILLKRRNFIVLHYHVHKQVSSDGIKVDMRVYVELDDNPGASPVLISQLPELESDLGELLRNDIRNLIKKMQKLKADPAGFGEQYRLAHRGFLQADEWVNAIFPKLPVDVNVRVQIERKGMLT